MPDQLVVPSLPPTVGITDPHVRAFCEALAGAWSVRNNGVGRDDERFVRKGEIGEMAAQAVVDTLSGAASINVASLQQGSATATYKKVLSAVERLVTGSKAYEFLRTPIQPIKPPTQELNQILARVNREVSDRVAAIEAEALARGSGITAEQASRIAADENLQTQIDTVVAIGGGNTATILAALTAEQTARIAGDTAEATSRDTLAAQIRGDYTGTSLAALTSGLLFDERQARVSADGAIVTSVTSLTARVATAESAIVNEQTARASADSAFSSSVTALTTRVATAEASILSQATTRSNKDNSLAQALNTIWASIGGASALIQDAALAAVSPAAVAATKWNQVQAAVTDPNTGQINSASIKQELNAYASKVDGTLNATWAIRANVGGVISGVSLMTTGGAGSAPGATSNFMIMADRLTLVNPANNALRATAFSVDYLGNAVFAGTIYAAAGVFGGSLNAATGTFDGTVSAAGVVSGTLSAARISVGTAAQAVTFFDPAQPSVPLQSTATGTFAYNADPGTAIVTGAAVDFRNNNTSVGIDRRIRTGLVTFTVLATATVDHYLSIWYRRNGGAWQFLYTGAEASPTYGSAAAGYSLALTVFANDRIEFGMNCTNSLGIPNNYSLTRILYAQLTVSARNF